MTASPIPHSLLIFKSYGKQKEENKILIAHKNINPESESDKIMSQLYVIDSNVDDTRQNTNYINTNILSIISRIDLLIALVILVAILGIVS